MKDLRERAEKWLERYCCLPEFGDVPPIDSLTALLEDVSQSAEARGYAAGLKAGQRVAREDAALLEALASQARRDPREA